MPANGRHADRHRRTVAALVDRLGVEPLDATTVPGPTPARVDVLRAGAEERVASARQQLDAATTRLDEARAEREQLEERAAELGRRRSDAEQARAAIQREVAEHRATITSLLDTATSTEPEIDRLEALASSILLIRQRAVRPIRAIAGRPLTDEDRRAHADELASTASELIPLDLDRPAGVLFGWAEALRDGTAATDPAARELLEALEQVDAEWVARGSGRPDADPEVQAAHAEVEAARTALAELESHARTGALGERARRAIEEAHAARVEIEERRKADPTALAAAIEAERAALAQVGFDSMLDYRVVISSTGTGALADKQRELAEARIRDATTQLDAALTSSRRHLATLEERRDQLLQEAAALLGDWNGDVHDGLARIPWVSPEIEQAIGDIVAGEQAAEGLVAAKKTELAELRAEADRLASTLPRLEGSLEQAVHDIDALDDDAAETGRRIEELDGRLLALGEEREGTAADLDQALAQYEGTKQLRYVPDDVEDLREALLVAIARRTAAAEVLVDDPLDVLELPDALEVFDAVLRTEWPCRITYVTSRPELISLAQQREGPVRCVDGRRRNRDGGRLRRLLVRTAQERS